jgi:hypothetical protein
MSPVRHAPAELTSADGSLRAQYLAEVLDLLYPQAQADIGAAIPAPRDDVEDVIAEYIVVPDARRARLLVPAGNRRIAAAAVERYAEATSRAAQLKRYAVIAALRTGASRMLLRDRVAITVPKQQPVDSIDTYLQKVLGREVSISVHIGPARANRKPVLQLLAPNGETIAFGKLGIGPLTRDLVRAETAALRSVNDAHLTALSVPTVLHAGKWHDHEVLVQSALPIWDPRTPLAPERLARAMREVAECKGTHTGTLAEDAYWKTLRGRLESVITRGGDVRADGTDPAGEARALAEAADALVARSGAVELGYGSWHGDWTPWNMASTESSLLVWDWERFTSGVPMGFDAVHFDFQRLVVKGVEPDSAVDTTLSRAGRLLEPFGVAESVANLTALLYLVDLATRYLEDRQAEAGARLGVLGRWLLPVLTRKVADL